MRCDAVQSGRSFPTFTRQLRLHLQGRSIREKTKDKEEAYSSIQKMAAATSSQKFIMIPKIICCHIPEDCLFQSHCRENFRYPNASYAGLCKRHLNKYRTKTREHFQTAALWVMSPFSLINAHQLFQKEWTLCFFSSDIGSVDQSLFGYDTTQSGRWLPIFRRNMVPPSSG